MTTRLRAAAPAFLSTADLGPLQDLPGTWMGSGLSVAELPDHRGGAPYRLRINATRETLTFTEIGAPIPGRGNNQDDIVLRGLHYLQQVSDARTNEALHVETGMWLFVPPTTVPIAVATIVRTANVPHGSVLLAQGTPLPDVAGAPDIPPLDTTPVGFTFGDGSFPPPDVRLPPDVPEQALRDPSVLLTDALKELTIVHTTTLDVRTGLDDIRNIGFVTANAQATKLSSTFWVETLSGPDGVETLQLQYSQRTTLRFPAGPRPDPARPIDWPHIQVATLLKQ
ncbi:heme-binding protein [Nocardia sp. NPDC051570]|uniref:heme-binding protein n=1 Tax=Nocardia sp. NPDC051570 TaxID=3364324 RepID=UPI0037B20038